MNRYKVTKTLGDGTYGSVFKAVQKQTGKLDCTSLPAPHIRILCMHWRPLCRRGRRD